MRKMNGRTTRSGSISFSTERGNLRSVSTRRHTGLAQSKTVHIESTASNTAVLTSKTASQAHVHPSKARAVVPLNKNYRRTEKTIRALVEKSGYRPDLTKDALKKYSAVYAGNRYARGVKKVVPVKKGRGKSSN